MYTQEDQGVTLKRHFWKKKKKKKKKHWIVVFAPLLS